MPYRMVVSLLIFFFINFRSFSQKLSADFVFGQWKVKDWLFFEKVNETPNEHAQRMNDYKRCLRAKFRIDSTGIRLLNPKNDLCYFDLCDNNFSISPKWLEKRIVADNDYTRQNQGAEMIDSNIVGKNFVRYLDKNYTKPTLLLLDAGCTQSYGDFAMKICIANKNRIGLFMGEELIILERIVFIKKTHSFF